MKVVVDTNQLLRMASNGVHSPLYRAWQAEAFELLISPPILAEFERVMVRPRIHRFLAPLLAQRFLSLLHHYAVMTTPTANTPAGRDPKDDMVIATALGGQADFIVTSDRDLLDDDSLKQTLAPYHLHIISPAEFLKQLDP